MGDIKNVVYEDRIGRDFDHKGVTLVLGRAEGLRKERIYNETLSRNETRYIGALAFLDVMNIKLYRMQTLEEPLGNCSLGLGN